MVTGRVVLAAAPLTETNNDPFDSLNDAVPVAPVEFDKEAASVAWCSPQSWPPKSPRENSPASLLKAAAALADELEVPLVAMLHPALGRTRAFNSSTPSRVIFARGRVGRRMPPKILESKLRIENSLSPK
jgi:hypothetical protein